MIVDVLKSVGNLEVNKDKLTRWRKIGKIILENSLSIVVGIKSKEHVVEDIELIILVSSERVIGVKVDKDLVVSWMKLGEVCELDVFNEDILLIMWSWYCCAEKGGLEECLCRSLERADHLFLEEEAEMIEFLRYDECLKNNKDLYIERLDCQLEKEEN